MAENTRVARGAKWNMESKQYWEKRMKGEKETAERQVLMHLGSDSAIDTLRHDGKP
jgi:hypothetical protein